MDILYILHQGVHYEGDNFIGAFETIPEVITAAEKVLGLTDFWVVNKIVIGQSYNQDNLDNIALEIGLR